MQSDTPDFITALISCDSCLRSSGQCDRNARVPGRVQRVVMRTLLESKRDLAEEVFRRTHRARRSDSAPRA